MILCDDPAATALTPLSTTQILDYGCGLGSFAEKVIKYNPRKITGIDISEISIDKAKKKAKELNIDINYKVDNCD